MSLKTLIESSILEGKNDEQIVDALLSSDEKTIESEINKFSSIELAEKIYSIRKSEEIKKQLSEKKIADEAKELEKKQADELEKRVEEKITEKLKSINFDPTRQYSSDYSKRFDFMQGKVIEDKPASEGKKAFNNLLRAKLAGRLVDAAKISEEIEQANKSTPSVSDVDSRGGYAVPDEVASEIAQLEYSESKLLPLVNRQTISSNGKMWPIMSSVSVNWLANQSASIAETNPSFTQVGFDMHRLAGYSSINNTLLSQKGVDITQAFTFSYARQCARKVDEQLVIGNITNSSDKFDGLVFNSKSKSDLTPVALGSVDRSTLQLMLRSFNSLGNRDNGVWLMNLKLLQTLTNLENSNGSYVYPNSSEGRNIKPEGYSVIEMSVIPSTLDVGGDARTGGSDDVIVFLDPSQLYVCLDPIRLDNSSEVEFLYDNVVFRGIQRFGFGMIHSNMAVVQEVTNS